MNTTETKPNDTGSVVSIFAAVRITFATIFVCCFVYPGVILIAARTLSPDTAEGSLIRDAQGRILGSELIAQRFSRPEYFWPRPSAVDFNATGAGGSNLSPASLALRSRVQGTLASLDASIGERVPADLVMASGSGLDPDISLGAAKYQATRVARARGVAVEAILELIGVLARRPGRSLTPHALVNVLQLNMELDRQR